MTPARYPLQWPLGWKRTLPGQRQRGTFAKRGYSSSGSYRPLNDVTVAEACGRLLAELKRMGISDQDVVISTNVRTRLDGLPYSNEREPEDPGAAVYWRDAGRDRCMAIDGYSRVAQNIAALAATIEAMRAIERHGGAAILDRAFTGFTALPAPIVAGMKRPWREVLNFPPGAIPDRDQLQRRFRELASKRHPDAGGSDGAMAEVNAARDEALQEIGGV